MSPQYVLNIIGIELDKTGLSLRYYDEKNSLGETYYRKYFDDWSTDDRQIRIWSKEKKMLSVIDFNRLLFSSEENNDRSKLLSLTKEVSKDYFARLDIKKVARIGFRTVAIVPFNDTFEKLVSKLQARFYPESEVLHSIAGKEFADVAFVVDFKKFGTYNHVQMGPVRDQEIKDKLVGSAQFIKDSKMPPVSLWIDVDMSTKDFPIEGLDHFLDEANKNAVEIIGQFADFSMK